MTAICSIYGKKPPLLWSWIFTYFVRNYIQFDKIVVMNIMITFRHNIDKDTFLLN